jgi:hypothetical protein
VCIDVLHGDVLSRRRFVCAPSVYLTANRGLQGILLC